MNRFMKSSYIVKLLIGLIVGGILMAFTHVKDDFFAIGKNLEIFAALYRQVSTTYVEEVNPNLLIKKGINSMLEELDPYTEFVPESDLDDFRLRYINTQYAGLGARIVGLEDKSIQIAEIFEDYPAHKAGLEVGDEIVSIDGQFVQGMAAEDVSHLLKGEEGTPIKLTVKKNLTGVRENKEIVRRKIIQPNISYSTILPANIGYIKLDKFLTGAADEVRKAILEMKRTTPLKGLVLDLRDNGGGILQESVKIVNFFVKQGQEVVFQQGRRGDSRFAYVTKQAPLALELPLVVLINERSASASEIVAGALQDLDRAVVLGRKSFGKGLVQQTYRLPYNNMVKVTVAKYYTPSGRCIQALDYAHRDNRGKAIKINDSLITEFSTVAGRKVYNGDGISPDIEVKEKKTSALIQELKNKFLISGYANRYYHTHDSLMKDLQLFRLSDEDYKDFLSYLSEQKFTYSSRAEKAFQYLRSALEDSNQVKQTVPELELLEQKIQSLKEKDFMIGKGEIAAALEEEIASRYYFQRGRYRIAQAKDEAIKKAQALLGATDHLVYNNVLSGKGGYHTIGKPRMHLASAESLN
ncbi:S41 family peptidase [Olivibacter sp. CPCC 100613]|uniref:S41 family peptidase n=1 Tax=Olivibacter sp. CPCC 100613 TaxID=3079931 RepID=UPI002FF4E865